MKNFYEINPIINPANSIPLIKNIYINPYRLHNYTTKKIHKIRDNYFRKMIKYTYNTPVYQEIYKKSGINPSDIQGLEGIKKIPFIEKKDISRGYPNNILPKNYDHRKATKVCTSGSSGKPLNFYTDFITYSYSIGIFLRELKIYGLHWKNSRIAHIGNASPNKIDNVHEKYLKSKVNIINSLKNYIFINAFEPVNLIIKKLNEFKPDLIISYPATFQKLAYFIKRGEGNKINPRLLNVGGYILDKYTKNYVEDAFNCKMFNVYGSAESGGDIAFECMKGNLHINYDYYHIEVIDDKKRICDDGEQGQIVLTRLFGKATPFIRYTGLNDWVTLEQDHSCECGLNTPIIKNGIEGRANTSVILPDGRVFPSAAFDHVSTVLNDLNTHKIRQFQIIQKKLNVIKINLVVDNELRKGKPTISEIIKEIQSNYEKLVGPDIQIIIEEVDEIKSLPNKPSPLVIQLSNDKL